MRDADVETKLKIEAKQLVSIFFDILILTFHLFSFQCHNDNNLLLFAHFIGSKIQLNTETLGK